MEYDFPGLAAVYGLEVPGGEHLDDEALKSLSARTPLIYELGAVLLRKRGDQAMLVHDVALFADPARQRQ